MNLVEEPDDLARNVLPSCLLMIHDTSRGRENKVPELTRRQQLHNPLLHILQLDVVSRADDTGFVETRSLSVSKNLHVAEDL